MPGLQGGTRCDRAVLPPSLQAIRNDAESPIGAFLQPTADDHIP